MYQENKGQVGAATVGGHSHGVLRSHGAGAIGGASKNITGYETIVKCNDCGATWNVNPPKKKIWLYVLIGIIVFFIIIALVSGGDDTSSTTNTEPQKTEFAIGEQYVSKNMEVVATSIEDYELNQYQQSLVAEGNKVVCTTFSYKNVSDVSQYISQSDFSCYADNVACDSIWLLENDTDVNANIDPGREATMRYCWTVPEGCQKIELTYQGVFSFDEKVNFVFDLSTEE